MNQAQRFLGRETVVRLMFVGLVVMLAACGPEASSSDQGDSGVGVDSVGAGALASASDPGAVKLPVVAIPVAGSLIDSDVVIVEFESPTPSHPAVLLVDDQIAGIAESGEEIEWNLAGFADGQVELIVLVAADDRESLVSEPIVVTIGRGVTIADLEPGALVGPEVSLLHSSVRFSIDNHGNRAFELFADREVVAQFDSDGTVVFDTTVLEDGHTRFQAIEISNQIESNSLYYVVGNELDSDNDGIRDVDDDYDGDTLTLADEQALGTSWIDADTDGDGLNDNIEVELGFDPVVFEEHDPDLIPSPDGGPAAPEEEDWRAHELADHASLDSLADQLELQSGSVVPSDPGGAGAGCWGAWPPLPERVYLTYAAPEGTRYFMTVSDAGTENAASYVEAVANADTCDLFTALPLPSLSKADSSASVTAGPKALTSVAFRVGSHLYAIDTVAPTDAALDLLDAIIDNRIETARSLN